MKKLLLKLCSVLVVTGSNLVAQNISGTLDAAFNYTALANSVDGMTIQPDGKIIIGQGGGFALIRLLPNGTLDNSFTAPVISTPYVIVNPNGKLYAFGGYSRRLLMNGTNDNASGQTQFTGGSVKTVALTNLGKMIVAGTFTGVASIGNTVNRIAKFDENLVIDGTFLLNNGTGFNGVVNTIAVDTINNKIYCGGNFTSFNGNTSNGICRLNANGTFDNTFNASGTGVSAAGVVNVIKILSDGRLYIGGDFSTYNSVTANGSIIISNAGANDASFVAYTGQNIVTDAVQLNNGQIMVSGNPVYNNRIKLVNINGSVDNYNLSPVNTVVDLLIYKILVPSAGKVLYGGWFNNSFGQARTNIAQMFMCDENISTAVTIVGGSIIATQSGANYQWYSVDNATESVTLIPGATSQTFTPSQNGFYNVQITKGSCFYTSSDINFPGTTGIETIDFLNSITLQPNPASAYFTLNNIEEGTSVTVMDVTGKVIVSNSVIDADKTMTIETDNLPNGIYVIQLKNNGAVAHKKLIISK